MHPNPIKASTIYNSFISFSVGHIDPIHNAPNTPSTMIVASTDSMAGFIDHSRAMFLLAGRGKGLRSVRRRSVK